MLKLGWGEGGVLVTANQGFFVSSTSNGQFFALDTTNQMYCLVLKKGPNTTKHTKMFFLVPNEDKCGGV